MDIFIVFEYNASDIRPWRYDREGDKTLFSFWDFYLYELIYIYIYVNDFLMV